MLAAKSCPTLCNPMDYSPARLLCPWNSPGKNTEVGSHSLLQRILLTQGSNLGLLHCRRTLYHLSRQGSPLIGKPSFSHSALQNEGCMFFQWMRKGSTVYRNSSDGFSMGRSLREWKSWEGKRWASQDDQHFQRFLLGFLLNSNQQTASGCFPSLSHQVFHV